MAEPTLQHTSKLWMTWHTFDDHVRMLANIISARDDLWKAANKGILGVTRGGLIPAVRLSHLLGCDFAGAIEPDQGYYGEFLVVDDICDTGKTFIRLKEFMPNALFVSPIVKPGGEFFCNAHSLRVPQSTWVVFPWES